MSQSAGVRFLASAVGAAVAEAVTLPTDVAKVRLQVQNSSGGEARYRGIVDCVVKVGKVEGLSALWKGLVPALVRQVSYHSFTFVLYEPLKAMVSSLGPEGAPPGYLQRLVSAGLAAAVAISLFNPTEVLKTQMQATSSSSSMKEVAARVWEKEGLRGFWAGVRPNVVRTFLVNGAEIGTYDEAKQVLLPFVGDGLAVHVGSSGVAGLASACVSTPADVVKTRFMNAAGTDQAHRSILHTATSIVRQEGCRALYKGFVLIVIRKVLWCIVFFVIYERLHAFLRNLLLEELVLEGS
mmetsp:Transcript_112630/g.313292  ORF Transcript_112630/g.313292 Transcript_112630/m.313292 type:complete len:295 (+) Transcript_112630:111-995(+)